MRTKQSLCQTCFNFDCSWHESFTPREDWEAIPTVIKEHGICEYYVDSYCVKRCPAYRKRDNAAHIGARDVCEALGISASTFYRYARNGFIAEYAKARGFSITWKQGGKYKKCYMVKKNE